jgi:hypothetical protein
MRRNKLIVAFVALAAFLGSIAFAENADAALDAQLAEGIRLHNAAEKDADPAANVAKGKEILSQIKDRSPIAKAYYGSILTIEANVWYQKKNLIKSLSVLDEGLSTIDAAVKAAPDVPDLRFLRMINSYEVTQGSPKNRYKIMKVDIDWLVAREKSFSPENQGSIELYKGLYLAKSHKVDEALDAFNACVAISPGSPEAAEAQKQIDKYSK